MNLNVTVTLKDKKTFTFNNVKNVESGLDNYYFDVVLKKYMNWNG